MYPQILHANTQDDHTNYDLLRANFSLIFCHQKLKLGKEKKQQGRTQKKILTRGSWGPFATNSTIILS